MDPEKRYVHLWYPEDDDKDFFLRVRIWSEWNEPQFQLMLSAANDFLDDLSQRQEINDRWDSAFTEQLQYLINHMRHPGFLSQNDRSLTAKEYLDFIEERVKMLDSLRTRYEILRGGLGAKGRHERHV